jgi:NTP pyrophosphatase (non-canonical NTP hydrolase)
MENFVELAIKTENRDISGIAGRLNSENVGQLLAVIEETISLGQKLDALKKNIFYGKSVVQPVASYAPATAAEVERLKQEKLNRLLHATVGIATEAVEMFEALKVAIQTGTLDEVNLAEEMGDVFWYQAVMSDTLQKPFSTVQETVIAKLKARYGDKFTEKSAVHRDLKAERSVLEAQL